jgi:hypothetical protein
MGQFRLTITAMGANGCDRRAGAGEKLHQRCGKFQCPDCMAYDFVQQMKQKGITIASATFTHNPGREGSEVVDDLIKNERVAGTL